MIKFLFITKTLKLTAIRLSSYLTEDTVSITKKMAYNYVGLHVVSIIFTRL